MYSDNKALERVLFAVLCMLIAISASARDTEFGVEGGYLRNSFHHNDYSTKDGNGFAAGAFVEYSFNDEWSLNSGLTFEMKSGEVYGDNIRYIRITSVKYKQINYLTLPITAGYAMKLNDDLTLKYQLGIYGAVGVGGTACQKGYDNVSERWYSSVYPAFGSQTLSLHDGFAPIDGGLLAQVNLRYRDFAIKLAWEHSVFPIMGTGNGMNQSWIAGVRYYIF